MFLECIAHAPGVTALAGEHRPTEGRALAVPQRGDGSAVAISPGQPRSLGLSQASGLGGFTAFFGRIRRPHKAASPGYCAGNHIPNQLQNWSTSVMSPCFGKGWQEYKSKTCSENCETF